MSATDKQNNQFNPSNAAILLIDHQPGVLAMVKSLPAETITTNTAILAGLGEELQIPSVITSTREEMEFLGTSLPEIQKAAPKHYENRVRRGGTLDAFRDSAFGEAVKKLNRRNLVIAGLTTDVCLFFSVVSALEAGYNVRVVADASGTSTEIGDIVTYDRLRSLGATITTTYGIMFELFPDLSRPEGQKAEGIAASAAKAGK